MGFDVNFNNKPIIQEAKSMQNDGGAGNLGYFEREENEKENQKNSSIFSEDGKDTFRKGGDIQSEDDGFSVAKIIAQIILAIKDFIKKIFG